MEIKTFQATDVPEIFTLTDKTAYLLVEIQSVDDLGLTVSTPFQISLGNLLRNVFSSNLYNVINTPAIRVSPNNPVSRSANTIHNNSDVLKHIQNLNKKINTLDSQIQFLLNKLG
jgi:hypothetical protein